MSPARFALRAASLAILAIVLTTTAARLSAADKAADSSKLPGAVKTDEFNDQAKGDEKPVNGGSLVIRYEAEPKVLSDLLDNSAVTQYICGYLYETLITRNSESYEMEPRVAEKWIQEDRVVKTDGTELRGKVADSAEGVTVTPSTGDPIKVPKAEVKDIFRATSTTFFIRKGVKWHDGEPLDARDVEFTWKILRNPLLEQPHITNYYEKLSRCEVLNDLTVRLTYSEQYWQALEFSGGFYVLPRHVFDPDGQIDKEPEAFFKKFKDHPKHMEPIGAGPFKFQKWEKGNALTLVRNPDFFWPEKGAHLDRVTFRFLSDDVVAIQALKNGEVDFNPRLTTPQFYEQTNDEEFLKKCVKGKIHYPNMGYLGWNMRKSPFDQKEVRKALEYAILDREDVLKKVYHNDGVIVTGPEYYYGAAYDHSVKPASFDPKKADEMLTEAGWFDHDGDGIRDKDGVPFKFELLKYSVAPDHPSNQMAALMVKNLKEIGIEMTVRQLEWPTYISNIEKLNFDCCMLGWVQSVESDPYQIWHSSQTGEQGSNHVGFVNAEADDLIMKMRPEIDAAKRHAMAFKLHQLLADEQPYFFLYCRPDYCAYRKIYRGVKLYRLRPGYDLTEWFIPKDLQQ